jgi:hypothetical protein
MGEEPRSRGIEAEDKAWKLIRALGYEIYEQPNEEYDIDCIAKFNTELPPYRSVKRPRYSPSGLTAFEVTSQRITQKKFTTFKEKLVEYNAHNAGSEIGGVILTDKSISNSMYSKMRVQEIFGWGPSRVVFYWQKVRIFGSWSAYGTVTEIEVDNDISCLRCFSPSSDYLFRFAIFFDDHAHVLSPAKTKAIMEKIREKSISPLIEQGLSPINVWFEYHALCDIKDLTKDLLSFVDKWRKDEIVVFIPPKDEAFKGYRTFPALLL